MRSVSRIFTCLTFIVIASPAVSENWPASGRDAKRIEYRGGVFREVGPKKWVEEGSNGAHFTFAEEKREPGAVTLYDASRKYRVILDIKSSVIMIDTTGFDFQKLAPITGVSADATAKQPAVPATKYLNIDAKLHSAAIAYPVSQKSPLLSSAERSAISQDFNGVPLSGKAATHRVVAARIACRASADAKPEGHGANCSIQFGSKDNPVNVDGDDGRNLYLALGRAGVPNEADIGHHIIRTIEDLVCVVDDKVAQGTPSTGDKVPGFTCTFKTEQLG